ncbi:MAG: bugT [Betaproteobacteria bacterium]|nr:bugT [Betaproteobacteria bacterium]
MQKMPAGARGAIMGRSQQETSIPMKRPSTFALLRASARPAAAIAALALCGAAGAQQYPDKPIHMVVPFAPGGGTDTVVRIIGPRLGAALGQPIVADYKPGAGTLIGTEFTAHAPPDGYTLLIGSASHALNPALHTKVNYSPTKDFQAISMAVSFPFILAVTNSLPVKNVKELIALAKKEPGTLGYGTAGLGSTPHLAGEVFKTMTGTDMIHVPFKGGGPSLTAAIGGQVPVLFGTAVETLPQVKGGKIRGLAVSSAKRSAAAPEMPTIAEAGVPGYDVTGWYVILAPAGTPKPIVDRLNTELVKILQMPEVKTQLLNTATEAWATTAAEAQDFVGRETVRWAQVIKKAGITPES